MLRFRQRSIFALEVQNLGTTWKIGWIHFSLSLTKCDVLNIKVASILQFRLTSDKRFTIIKLNNRGPYPLWRHLLVNLWEKTKRQEIASRFPRKIIFVLYFCRNWAVFDAHFLSGKNYWEILFCKKFFLK